MTPAPAERRALTALRKLLVSHDAREVRQGLHLLVSLDAATLLATVAEGLAVRAIAFPRARADESDTSARSPTGMIDTLHIGPDPEVHARTKGSWIGWHVRAEHRGTVALHVARAVGLLDGVRRLVVVAPVWDLTPLRGLTALEELWIDDGTWAMSLDGLSDLPALRALHLRCFPRVEDLDGLAELPAVEHVALATFRSLRDLRALGALPRLASLEVDGCSALEDIGFLADLPGLERLALRALGPIADWSPLAHRARMRALDLGSCHNRPEEDVLRTLVGLEALDLSRTDLTSLAPFVALQRLRSLRLRTCPLVDVRAVTELPLLQELDLRGCWKLPGRYQNLLTANLVPAVQAFFRDPRARFATVCAPLLRADGPVEPMVLREVLRCLGEETVVGEALVPFLRLVDATGAPPDPFAELPDADELPF